MFDEWRSLPLRPNVNEGAETLRVSKRKAVSLWGATVAYGLGTATGGVAQDIVRIDDRPQCAQCRIDVERIATLTPPSEEFSVVRLPTPSVARDLGGRYVVGLVLGQAAIAVFDGSGTWSHSVGRLGEGPGEYYNARMLLRVDSADSLHVFQLTRETVLAPGARTVARAKTIEVSPSDIVFCGGRRIVAAVVRAPRGTSTPVQVLARDGSVVEGIGLVAGRPLSFDHPVFVARRLACAGESANVWSAYWTRYELSRFTPAGDEEVRIVRVGEWFSPYEPEPGEGWMIPQRPILEGLVDLGDGTVLVALSEADAEYAAPVSDNPEGAPIDPFVGNDRRLDTVLEVLDIATGQVLARRKLDEYLGIVSTAGRQEPLFFSLREEGTGDLVVDVWRVRMVRD